MEPRIFKQQHVGVHDDAKWQSLNKYEDEGEGKDIRYISLPFVALLPPRNESNHLTDMGKRTRNLNYYVCIPLNHFVYIRKLII